MVGNISLNGVRRSSAVINWRIPFFFPGVRKREGRNENQGNDRKRVLSSRGRFAELQGVIKTSSIVEYKVLQTLRSTLVSEVIHGSCGRHGH